MLCFILFSYQGHLLHLCFPPHTISIKHQRLHAQNSIYFYVSHMTWSSASVSQLLLDSENPGFTPNSVDCCSCLPEQCDLSDSGPWLCKAYSHRGSSLSCLSMQMLEAEAVPTLVGMLGSQPAAADLLCFMATQQQCKEAFLRSKALGSLVDCLHASVSSGIVLTAANRSHLLWSDVCVNRCSITASLRLPPGCLINCMVCFMCMTRWKSPHVLTIHQLAYAKAHQL